MMAAAIRRHNIVGRVNAKVDRAFCGIQPVMGGLVGRAERAKVRRGRRSGSSNNQGAGGKYKECFRHVNTPGR